MNLSRHGDLLGVLSPTAPGQGSGPHLCSGLCGCRWVPHPLRHSRSSRRAWFDVRCSEPPLRSRASFLTGTLHLHWLKGDLCLVLGAQCHPQAEPPPLNFRALLGKKGASSGVSGPDADCSDSCLFLAFSGASISFPHPRLN